MVPVLQCSGIRCERKFAINAGLVRQFKEGKLPQSSGSKHSKNMIENVIVCFEVHIEKN